MRHAEVAPRPEGKAGQGGRLAHQDLVNLAVRWLKRPTSRGGHGCQVAVSECRPSTPGEALDAIGFREAGVGDGSVVIECKTSRADFLADRSKPHRQSGKGMGNWRYFLCPEGLIGAEEVPAGWGLLYAAPRGKVVAVSGPVIHLQANGGDVGNIRFPEVLDWYRNRNNAARERALLVQLLARLGDVEALNKRLREEMNRAERLARQVDALNASMPARQRRRRGPPGR